MEIKNLKDLIIKIRDDDEFYFNKFLKIRTKDSELVNFQLNNAQKKSLELIQEKRKQGLPVRVIWLKARQLGISTFCEGMIFKDTSNNNFKNSLIIAHEDKATQNLFSMSKLMYEELPPLIRPMKKYSNESALSFENPTNNDDEKYANPGLRSKITVATARNVQTARSLTVHNLHASEVAFWDGAEVLMTGLLQAVPYSPNSMVFLESTANGIGGWFYNFWQSAVKGENEYTPIFLAWFDNPDYKREFLSKEQKEEFIKECSLDKDCMELVNVYGISYEQLNWRKWCIQNNCNGDLDKFHQEYPSTPEEAFIVSGRPVFPITQVKEYQNAITPPIKSGYIEKGIFIDDDKGYIKIWKEPQNNKFYVLGADVAEGLIKGDYSCGIVLSEDFELCASWHGHIDPDLFGIELIKLAKYYNDAYLGVESNNHGYTTLRAIINNEYWNLFFQKTYNKINDAVTQKPGWCTNKKTKPLMINTLCEFIRERWLKLQWKTLVSELFTYVRAEDGSTNSQSDSNDDTIMALAIALQLLLEGRGENYTPERTDKEDDYDDLTIKRKTPKDIDEDVMLEISN